MLRFGKGDGKCKTCGRVVQDNRHFSIECEGIKELKEKMSRKMNTIWKDHRIEKIQWRVIWDQNKPPDEEEIVGFGVSGLIWRTEIRKLTKEKEWSEVRNILQ